jgi:chromosome segregation ATPase
MPTRSQLFKQLAKQYHAVQTSFDGLCLEMNNKEEEHKRALAEEKSEVTRLQRELDRVVKVKDKVKAERDAMRRERDTAVKERETLKAGLAKRAEADNKIQSTIAESEAKVKAAKDELAAHKESSAKWLAELASLNEDMDRKFAESLLFLWLLTDIQFHVLSHLTWY